MILPELWYLVIPARSREHAEAIHQELLALSKTMGWPRPLAIRAAVEEHAPPGLTETDSPMAAETATEIEEEETNG